MHRHLLLAVALVSCKGDPSVAAAPEPEASAQDDDGFYRTQECRDLLGRYREVLAAAPGTCAQDSDCARYGAVDPDDLCGGSTDRATAKALAEVRDTMRDAGCPAPPYSCPAYEGVCTDGKCQPPEGM